MPSVNDANTATEIALTFIKKYYYFPHPLKAVRENTTWVVEIDIGMLLTDIIIVKINANDGSIISYGRE